MMKEMNSETHSWTVSFESLPILAFSGSTFFIILAMLAMGKYRSCDDEVMVKIYLMLAKNILRIEAATKQQYINCLRTNQQAILKNASINGNNKLSNNAIHMQDESHLLQHITLVFSHPMERPLISGSSHWGRNPSRRRIYGSIW